MRRLVKLALIALGIRALWAWHRRRQAAAAAVTPASTATDPADELRRKLAESREEEEPTAESVTAPEPTVEERRSEVHTQGRAAVDEMTSSDPE